MMIVKIISKIIHLLEILYFTPHYIVYRSVCKNGLDNEFNMWVSVISIDFQSERKNFFWYIINLKEFRSFFYMRLESTLAKVLAAWAPGQSGLSFGTSSQNISSGLILHHCHSTEINASEIGRNCHIWQNVTVGKKYSGGGRPKIGNDVKIYTGAVVLGDIVIGDNVEIGANAVVLKNVPSDCVVVGNPARIVRRNGLRVDERL